MCTLLLQVEGLQKELREVKASHQELQSRVASSSKSRERDLNTIRTLTENNDKLRTDRLRLENRGQSHRYGRRGPTAGISASIDHTEHFRVATIVLHLVNSNVVATPRVRQCGCNCICGPFWEIQK